MPGALPTPEQQAKIAAALLREPASTQRMAALLQEIIHSADPMRNPFRSTEKLAILRDKIARTTDVGQLLDARMQLVLNLLQTGQNDEALKENEAIMADIRQYVPPDNKNMPRWVEKLMSMSALALLRMG